jgi:hypothetical protein
MLAAPQIGMLILIRSTDVLALKILFLGASIAMVGAFARFIGTADLTSTSTAPLGVIFFPFYLAMASSAAGWLLLWAASAIRRAKG